jgi:hypothetical protein
MFNNFHFRDLIKLILLLKVRKISVSFVSDNKKQEQTAVKKWVESGIGEYKISPFYWLRQNKKTQKRKPQQE